MSFFELLFKYKPIVYEKGRLAFQLLPSPGWFIPFVLLAGGVAYWMYRRHVGREKWHWGLVAIRALTLSILAFVAFRPVMNISTVLPQESYLAVVVDDSESMSIRDDGVEARSGALLKQMEATNFLKRLSDKFKVRLYRFSKETERIESLDRLAFSGKRTSLESPVQLLDQEMSTVPLSGVVLITDGADNASRRWTESLARLESRRIPIYAVGVGTDQITRDAEIVNVAVPREMLKESTAVVEVSYRSHGLAGRRATLQVREEGTLIKSEELTLPRDGEVGEKTIDVPLKNDGSRLFSFSIQASDDRIPENNSQDSMISVRNDHPRVLYIEGEPRWEYRFIRRAVHDDPNVQLVTLLRSSQNKFYRQGIDNEQMLADGFPKTKEELFQYKGLVFGSIESTFFTREQLDNVAEFVSSRGGGFLMIGGKNSFSGGKYQNSPIAEILPVTLPPEASPPVLEKVRMQVTDFGRTHPLMKLSPDAAVSAKQWVDLPFLSEYNRTLDAKSGATVLARGQSEAGRASPILLATERYGRGRTMAFTSGSSWRWQMEMNHEDLTHEQFWKQVLRWLVSGTPDQIMVSSDKDTYLPDEPIRLVGEVADKNFERLNSARVVAKIIDPEGQSRTVPMDWSGRQEGSYETQLGTNEPGLYRVEIEATQGSETLGTARTSFRVQDRPVEFYNAALDSRLLESVAAGTGGRYYPLSRLGDVPDEVVYLEGETSFVDQKELWDLPVLFLLLCMALGGEWFWRKQKGLA